MTDDPIDQLEEAAAREAALDPDQARRADLRARVHTFAELAAVETQAAEPVLGPFVRRKWRTIVIGHTGEGKAEWLDNRIFTPAGWRRFGDLMPGDQVFGDDGRPCNVVAVSPVWKNRELYRVVTKDGASWVVDAAHEWRLSSGEMIETREMAFRCQRTHRRQAVDLHGALQMPDADLPIHPYLLGAWLGDGSTSDGVLHFCSPEKMEAVGGRIMAVQCLELRKRANKKAYGVFGLMGMLRDLGILGNKRIPRIYMHASYEQRLELLKGIVDTDGHVSERGQVEVVSVSKDLAEDIAELVRTMGVRVGFSQGPATIDGRYISEKYRVRFRMAGCATWGARAERARAARKYAAHYLWAEPLGQVGETMCIQVDSPTHLYLSGPEMVPTHNTTLVSRMVGALVTGGTFLGYRAEKCKVLVIDVEQDETMAQERIGEAVLGSEYRGNTLAEAMAAVPEAHTSFYCRWTEGLALDEQTVDRQVLREVIDEVRPDVVVLDPLYKAFLGNPNEPQLAAMVMRFMDALREEYGFALVVPMHPRKEQQGVTAKRLTKHDAYGGAGWIWGAEMIVGIERMPGSQGLLSFFKDRSNTVEPDTKWSLSYSTAEGFKRLREIIPGEATAAEDLILDLLRKAPGEWFDREAIASQMPGKSERTVRNALVELKKRKETGKLPRLQMRAGSRGAYHYSWTPAANRADIVEDLKAQVALDFDAIEEDDDGD